MSLLASIDVGSNTLRLLIAEVEDNKLINVFSDRKITRLGNGVAQTGRLHDENIEATISVLGEFSSVISQYGVRHVKAVATSALREASNSDFFVKRVLDATGISIEVIPGKKEAELTLRGVLYSFPGYECGTSAPLFPPLSLGGPGRLFIIDIGGGSTEWILCRGKQDIAMGSIPIGVIKLTENFLKTDPITGTDLNALNDEIVQLIEELEKRVGRLINGHTRFVGTAGTFTTIAAIDLGLEEYSREKIHLHAVSLSKLKAIGRMLASLPLEERRKTKGLEPERADLIIPGVQFTIKIMEFFKFDELIISDYGLLEGALLDIEKDISKAGKS